MTEDIVYGLTKQEWRTLDNLIRDVNLELGDLIDAPLVGSHRRELTNVIGLMGDITSWLHKMNRI